MRRRNPNSGGNCGELRFRLRSKTCGDVPRTASLLGRFSEEDVWRSTPFVPRNARQCCTVLSVARLRVVAGLQLVLSVLGMKELLLQVGSGCFFQKLDEEGVCKTAMLCWVIWRARNELIWKKRKMTINEVVTMARIELDQRRNAKEKGIMPSFSSPDIMDGAKRSSKIDGDTIKVNVDAAIFADSESFGVGWVPRGRDGRLIEGGTLTMGGLISPRVVEAIGVREAFSWIKRKGWKEVIVKIDCLEVVQAARSKVTT